MLLSVIFIVVLIPSLTTTNPVENNNSPSKSNRAHANSRSGHWLSSSSNEDDIFQDDFFTSGAFPLAQPVLDMGDPVLRDIYDEERRLDLVGDFDIRSEEARELINFQREKLQRERETSSEDETHKMPQGRSLFPSEPQPPERGALSIPTYDSSSSEGGDFRTNNHDDYSTEFPILLPSTTELPHSSTTEKPKAGFLGMGGVLNKFGSGVRSTLNVLTKPIRGSSGQTTTTTQPTSGSVHFPDDNDKTFDTSNSGSSNSVVFESDTTSSTTNPPVSTMPILSCNGTQTQYNGACYNVLQNLPCGDNQWLVEDDATGMGKCAENKCSQTRQVYFGGKCIMAGSEGHCHKGMVPHVYKNGDVECDCNKNFLYNRNDDNCYPAWRQGPCRSGEIYVARITPRGALPPTCIRNKCSKENFFCNAPSCPNDRNCIELSSTCQVDEGTAGAWDIDDKSLRPICKKHSFRVIGNVPTLKCAPGSRRDILGTCRTPSAFEFS